MLLVPSVKKTRGTGHLKRCMRLLDAIDTARIFVPSGRDEWNAEEVRRMFPEVKPWRIVERRDNYHGRVIIFDNFATSRTEYKRLASGCKSIGIDEGGPARGLFDYLIDTFPRLSSKFPANVDDERLVADGPAFPPRRVYHLRRVLLSFGGEDPAGLTGITLSAIIKSGLIDPDNVDVVVGPAFRKEPTYWGGRILRGLSDIRPLFREYDAVFTSFGITAYEAERAGVLPVLVNPTRYHSKLAIRAGFHSIGERVISPRLLRDIVLYPLAPRDRGEPEKSLADIIKGVDFAE